MNIDERVPFQDAMRWQEQRCGDSGSPVAAMIIAAIAKWVGDNPTKFAHIGSTVRFGDFIPLRLMAAIHFMALSRLAPELALYLPTLGGHADAYQPRFAEIIRTSLDDHPAIIEDFLCRIPQTNEPGRMRVLRAALDYIGATKPIVLREIGCSAGLNLSVAESRDFEEKIVSRIGCDVAPIDSLTEEGRRRLSAYVWVDDVARFQRLGAAIAQARHVKPKVVACDAAEFISGQALAQGVTTVVWQSALHPYLDVHHRQAVEEALCAVGAGASRESRFIHASWEDLGETNDVRRAFGLAIREWDGSTPEPKMRIIARGSSHGDVIEGAA